MPKILDEVRDVMRLYHYSIHTERTYIEWIKRFIHFHKMRSRDDLADGKHKIETFLTHLAVDLKAAPAAWNLAMNGARSVMFFRLDNAVGRQQNRLPGHPARSRVHSVRPAWW